MTGLQTSILPQLCLLQRLDSSRTSIHIIAWACSGRMTTLIYYGIRAALV
jgi:hypothetical protein